jgi:hypothetical protein
MRTIHKFSVSAADVGISGEFEVEMPRNADILCVQTQNDHPQIWAIVDDAAKLEIRRLVVVGTGWDLPADLGRGEYIGTFQTDGCFVWHVFATKPNAISGAAA